VTSPEATVVRSVVLTEPDPVRAAIAGLVAPLLGRRWRAVRAPAGGTGVALVAFTAVPEPWALTIVLAGVVAVCVGAGAVAGVVVRGRRDARDALARGARFTVEALPSRLVVGRDDTTLLDARWSSFRTPCRVLAHLVIPIRGTATALVVPPRVADPGLEEVVRERIAHAATAS
jgi:hypothetical protein